jgi:hypothetical protein
MPQPAVADGGSEVYPWAADLPSCAKDRIPARRGLSVTSVTNAHDQVRLQRSPALRTGISFPGDRFVIPITELDPALV